MAASLNNNWGICIMAVAKATTVVTDNGSGSSVGDSNGGVLQANQQSLQTSADNYNRFIVIVVVSGLLIPVFVALSCWLSWRKSSRGQEGATGSNSSPSVASGECPDRVAPPDYDDLGGGHGDGGCCDAEDSCCVSVTPLSSSPDSADFDAGSYSTVASLSSDYLSEEREPPAPPSSVFFLRDGDESSKPEASFSGGYHGDKTSLFFIGVQGCHSEKRMHDVGPIAIRVHHSPSLLVSVVS